jgi:lipopolysaccharide transport system ATP-binding protein
VLAVGDEAYQVRCMERINTLRRNGTAILFVSHDMATIERMCNRVIWLDHGRLMLSGESAQVVAAYRAAEN